jgi:serine/threonine-protein kinase
MSDLDAERARTEAIAAAGRGLLDLAGVWDAAIRFCEERAAPGTIESAIPIDVAPADSDVHAAEASPPRSAVPVTRDRSDEGWRKAAADPLLAQPAEPTVPVHRYQLRAEIGRGGVGRVVTAYDRQIGRTVALKILREEHSTDAEVRRRFVEEGQIAAQLEHPSVIPVHDLGVLPDGQLFYTMRIVERRSLATVLRHRLQRQEWSLVRLCTTFVQICRAMAYAHERGVVHRDLKPDNVLLGEYGEVYVADWGIAKRLGATEDPVRVERGAPALESTALGAVLGTPGYMPPEQARGDWAELDQRADVFALGTILYEILCGQRPFRGATATDVVKATFEGKPRRPSSVKPGCPLDLEDLCLRMLAPSKEERPGSAEEVADEVEAFLEGAKERDRRRQEAIALCVQALEPAVRYEALEGEREKLRAEARRLSLGVQPWDAVEKKRAVWALEDRAHAVDREEAEAFAEAVELFSRALGHDPHHEAARRGLADLFWTRVERAENERNEPERIYYETLVREYDDGTYTPILTADATIVLSSDPPAAEVVAYRSVEQDRVLVAVRDTLIGRTPVREARLTPGRYVLALRQAGYLETRLPLECRRGTRMELHVRCFEPRAVAAGCVVIPEGPALLGGDPDAFDPLPREERHVDAFAIARTPVTFDEYLEWINELWKDDPAQAWKRLPRTGGTEGLLCSQDPSGLWRPNPAALLDEDAERTFPVEQVGRLPLVAIDWFDAVAYARWRAAREGIRWRLPTEAEREKAGRGADGRLFPWGDRFDPTFCKMRDSRPGAPQPEPTGTFQRDESPYGVRDLAGSSRDWVLDVDGELGAEAALAEREPAPGLARERSGLRIARGGGWSLPAPFSRLASRTRLGMRERLPDLGLRLVQEL